MASESLLRRARDEPGSEQNSTSEEPPSVPGCYVALHGSKLNEALQAFASLRTTLLDSLLVFSEHGLMIHGTVFGEQVYVPVDRDRFSRYQWTGPAAAFLSLVDQKRSLLNVLRGNQHANLQRVDFEIAGASPFRTLTQRIWEESPESPESYSPAETLLKRELTSFSVLLPQDAPDVRLHLTRAQLNKVCDVTQTPGSTDPACTRTTFELGVSGKFSVYNDNSCVTFVAREKGGGSVDGEDQANILAAALKKSGHSAVTAKTVYGENVHRAFSVALEAADTLRPVLRRLQMRGGTLKFFLSAEIPTLCVTAADSHAASAIFFLAPRPAPSLREPPEVMTKPERSPSTSPTHHQVGRGSPAPHASSSPTTRSHAAHAIHRSNEPRRLGADIRTMFGPANDTAQARAAAVERVSRDADREADRPANKKARCDSGGVTE
ncbi:DNA polymerase processivity subunit [Saimiriine alphaherpesvirus 1]|uniref:DNA polymerase processivity factor n=1 Tax=Saimiriine herpesvirus 1 (strain MV-5-4-PSL) TaxID=10353 RepID=E2IUC7_SHV1|nr:DNA polymerase processivity subunit [Saimiriine alphaherpesvirus 1]ADO13785.1 DNA polymerase processivity subunit [Saimiriine alphaherpesvirus 1]